MILIVPSRRSFLTGLVGLIAAPAIVRIETLMRVKSFYDGPDWTKVYLKEFYRGRFVWVESDTPQTYRFASMQDYARWEPERIRQLNTRKGQDEQLLKDVFSGALILEGPCPKQTNQFVMSWSPSVMGRIAP